MEWNGMERKKKEKKGSGTVRMGWVFANYFIDNSQIDPYLDTKMNCVCSRFPANRRTWKASVL